MPITSNFYTPEQVAAGADQVYKSVANVVGASGGPGANQGTQIQAAVGLPDTLDEGTYEITLKYLASFLVPSVDTPKQVELAGWVATLTKYEDDTVNKQLHLTVKLERSAPAAYQEGAFPAIPMGTVVFAITVVFGLAAIFFTVVEVRKVFEAPSLNILLIIGGAIVLVYFIFGSKLLKGLKPG
jgi:hypothetical protein